MLGKRCRKLNQDEAGDKRKKKAAEEKKQQGDSEYDGADHYETTDSEYHSEDEEVTQEEVPDQCDPSTYWKCQALATNPVMDFFSKVGGSGYFSLYRSSVIHSVICVAAKAYPEDAHHVVIQMLSLVINLLRTGGHASPPMLDTIVRIANHYGLYKHLDVRVFDDGKRLVYCVRDLLDTDQMRATFPHMNMVETCRLIEKMRYHGRELSFRRRRHRARYIWGFDAQVTSVRIASPNISTGKHNFFAMETFVKVTRIHSDHDNRKFKYEIGNTACYDLSQNRNYWSFKQ